MAEIATRSGVENLTLWQRVYDHLRTEILEGRLEPGAELGEVALAEQLGVSRGPLREAIGRLAAEGLVTVSPRRGAVVRTLSKEEFLELYQVREALASLNEEMEAHAAGNKVELFFEANLAFHAQLLEASGNQKLEELYRQLLDQLGRYRLRSLTLRGNLKRSVSEHKAILRAASRGDAERAAQLMAEHIRVPQRRAMALEEAEPT
jgi:DNA-binding GntR family transcriptional regulator